jgi:hypothetical protein
MRYDFNGSHFYPGLAEDEHLSVCISEKYIGKGCRGA